MSPANPAEGPDRAAGGALGSIPAVCLHDHLDGGLRPATVVELAREAGHELPEEDPELLRDWFRAGADSGSLERYLTTFEHTVGVLQTAQALSRVAAEFVEDCAREGIIHCEVRWAPEQHTAGGLSPEQAVDAVQEGMARGVRAVKAAGGHISAVQILCAMRHLDSSLEMARLTVERVRRIGSAPAPGAVPGEPAPGSVVAFDLAGPEDGYPPSRHRAALELLAQQLVPVTIHAGEAAGAESMRDAVVTGRALRLGHGVRLLADDAAARSPLARWILDRRIALEVCPSSNLQTGAVRGTTIAGHPVTALLRRGFAVTVSPDNRLMSGTSVRRELELLVGRAGWSRADVVAVQLHAARAAFVPWEYRQWLLRRIEEAAR